MVLGLRYLLEECGEELVTVGEDVHLVALEGQGPPLTCQHTHQWSVLLGHRQVLLLHIAHH